MTLLPSDLPEPTTLTGSSGSGTGWSRQRRTVALLLGYMNLSGVSYEDHVRAAFERACSERDLNLLLVYGRGLGEPYANSKTHNRVYQLLSQRSVDGIIAMSTLLSVHSDPERVASLLASYQPLPVCSVGLEISAVPSVLVEGHVGVAELTRHLIRHHGRRKLVFIGGVVSNQDAQARLDAFRGVLGEEGILLEERRFAVGDFNSSGGAKAMEGLIASGLDIDGVVAANDTMALAAVEVLRRSGRNVPVDVAVTGFDDITLARLGSPSLSTVAQPFDELAQCAVQVILDQIAEKQVPLVQRLAARSVLRRSCGCGLRSDAEAPAKRVQEASAVRHGAHLQLITEQLAEIHAQQHAPTLAEALSLELGGKRGEFLECLENILGVWKGPSESGRTFVDLLLALRRRLQTPAAPELEELWHEARDAVARAEITWQAQSRVELDRAHWQLFVAGERLSLVHDHPTLQAAVAENLPNIGITTALVSRYVEGSAERLVPVLMLVDGATQSAPASFSDDRLWPPQAVLDERRRTLALFPLVFESDALGVVVFEYQPQVVRYPMVYSMVRDQIAAGLRSVALNEEVLLKTRLHERSVQERLATFQRMQALSVLAGGVAHDLNNTLGPLAILPAMMQRQLRRLQGDPQLLDELSEDLSSVKVAADRTVQTVKNLLTLGRQGRIPKLVLDLNRTLTEALSAAALKGLFDDQGRVNVELQLGTAPLLVKAAESQLVRALMNLLRNSVEAMGGQGTVVVRATASVLSEPHEGYEVIEPGAYVLVAVQDSGSGIAAAALPRVFEPFFSSKRAGEHSGTGLGLAIVHGVVKEHDGFVDVTSELGKGTTFTLYVPSAAPEQEALG